MPRRRRYRRWDAEEKRSICRQTRAPGVSVAQVARRHALNANLIFKWLKDPRFAAPAAIDPEPVFRNGRLRSTLRAQPPMIANRYTYRFNRRRQLNSIIERLVWAAVRTAPHSCQVVIVDACVGQGTL
jgi:hypothetical protein